jgi:hypothetical protein
MDLHLRIVVGHNMVNEAGLATKDDFGFFRFPLLLIAQ